MSRRTSPAPVAKKPCKYTPAEINALLEMFDKMDSEYRFQVERQKPKTLTELVREVNWEYHARMINGVCADPTVPVIDTRRKVYRDLRKHYEEQVAPKLELKRTFVLYKHCQLTLGETEAAALFDFYYTTPEEAGAQKEEEAGEKDEEEEDREAQ